MDENLAKDAALGAVAGAIATFAMGTVSTAIYDRESSLIHMQEDWVLGGKSSHQIAAEKLADLTGLALSSEQEGALATALPFGLGIGSAAAYGAVRKQIPGPAVAKGLGLGIALWLIADEGANPLLGITPGPKAFPWQTHARGLAAHLTFGLVTEGVLSLADRFLPARRK